MEEIIAFDKNFNDRLKEYEQIFSGLENVPFSKLKTEWAYYLELTVDKSGWQAFWKIPRLKCEELKITFPTIVLVYVSDIEFLNLTASVKILAVQDDIQLPMKHFVPLSQLWPTKTQDKSIALNMDLLSNALDLYRFFFIHLLMPWDEEEDSPDWKRDHLVSRLRLYYDLRNGNIPKATCEHIHALINEARRLSNKREQLTDMCDDIDSDSENNDDQRIEGLIKINVRIIEIQNELNLLENEMFRKVILKRQESSDTERFNSDKRHIWIISKGDTASNYIRLLNSVEELYPHQSMTFASNLMSKLESANHHDIILLNAEEHTVKTEGALIDNVTIKGVDSRNQVQILSLAEDVMFNCVGDSIIIENIIFDCKKSQCAVLVRKGHVTMRNCKLIGINSCSTRQGITVLNNAKLSLISCDLSGFSTAIIGNTGSSITIEKCLIEKAHCGLLIHENCQTAISTTVIKSCEEFGIVVEYERDLARELQTEQSIDALNLLPYVSTKFVKGSGNGKGDVCIKKCRISPIENLFENPDCNVTIMDDLSSNEDLELKEANVSDTVVEMYN
ncbi:protein nessun dorma [Euwallacea fornicatus]|uniref:protein nessun dorma n=1 Tax=Euwallacea fornicatus TaxID=995702 RepID=UPI00338F5A22